MFVLIIIINTESIMDKRKLIELSAPIVGGAVGVLIGLCLFLYKGQVKPDSFYTGDIK